MIVWTAFALIFLTGIGLGAVLIEVVRPWLRQHWRKPDHYMARWKTHG